MIHTRPICPRCASDAFYNYGHARSGKKRYLCLICNRQFVMTHKEKTFKHRPMCKECQGKMHIYKRENDTVRFRCAAYPKCKGYEKTALCDLYELSKE